MLSVFTPAVDEMALPAIIPVKIQDLTLWTYLGTGSGRNFISSETTKTLKLNPKRHETRKMVTLNGKKRQSMPVFSNTMVSLDGRKREKIVKVLKARCQIRNSKTAKHERTEVQT